jgi:TRAP-type C4-dicarboxylate transport system permease small subunit
MKEAAEKLGRIIGSIEDGFLVVLLAAMILIAAFQIFLRNVFDSGLSWADELLRIQVLWIGLMGAVVASRDRRHINIDILSRFLPQRLQAVTGALTDLFTAIVCGMISFHSGRFIHQEIEFGAIGLGRIPAWIFAAIIPAAFGLIGFRYLVSFIGRLLAWRNTESPRRTGTGSVLDSERA